MKVSPAAVIGVVFLLLLASAASFLAANSSSRDGTKTGLHPLWAEVKWPFAVDEWGAEGLMPAGRPIATQTWRFISEQRLDFVCRGVDDDDELERVSDLELAGKRHFASGPGYLITVSSMRGRSRPYVITNSLGSSSAALAIAFHDRCDLVVATVVFGDGRTADLDVAVMQFLNSDLVRHWLERTLGL